MCDTWCIKHHQFYVKVEGVWFDRCTPWLNNKTNCTHSPKREIGLNTSWSTLKDQCRCVTPVCASLACMTIKWTWLVIRSKLNANGRAMLVCTQQLSRFLFEINFKLKYHGYQKDLCQQLVYGHCISYDPNLDYHTILIEYVVRQRNSSCSQHGLCARSDSLARSHTCNQYSCRVYVETILCAINAYNSLKLGFMWFESTIENNFNVWTV